MNAIQARKCKRHTILKLQLVLADDPEIIGTGPRYHTFVHVGADVSVSCRPWFWRAIHVQFGRLTTTRFRQFQEPGLAVDGHGQKKTDVVKYPQGYSTTSVYSSTRPPAGPVCALASHPTKLGGLLAKIQRLPPRQLIVSLASEYARRWLFCLSNRWSPYLSRVTDVQLKKEFALYSTSDRAFYSDKAWPGPRKGDD
jgi:hypothetical protein